MKKFIISIGAIVMLALLCGVPALITMPFLCSDTVSAAGILSENGLWEYEISGETATLTKYKGSAEDVYIPSNIDGISVQKLGDNAFSGNTALTSATLGTGIQIIGDSAFAGCTNLVCIVTTEDLTQIGANAFSGCTNMNSIILYDSVASVGENAFASCPKLIIYCNEGSAGYTYATTHDVNYAILNPDTEPEIVIENDITYFITNGEARIMKCAVLWGEVVIPAYVNGKPVTKISDGLFQGARRITSITLPETITEIGEYAFSRCNFESIKLPSSLTRIGAYAFEDCGLLRSIEIPEGIEEIAIGTFQYCDALHDVQLPSTLKVIQERAFSTCFQYEEDNCAIQLPEGITEIGREAFYECFGMKEINIPDSITKIGDDAFYTCDGLEKVCVSDISAWCNISFANSSSNPLSEADNLYLNGELVTNLVIPPGVTSIGDYAFSGCRGLTSVTMPDSVKIINRGAFSGCTKLQTVNLNEGLERIDLSAFSNNGKLISMVVPKTVKYVTGTCSIILCVYEGSPVITYAQGKIFRIS